MKRKPLCLIAGALAILNPMRFNTGQQNTYNIYEHMPLNDSSKYNQGKILKIQNFRREIEKYMSDSYLVSKQEIYMTCNRAVNILKNEASLLEISGPSLVIGDLHGDLDSLKFCCEKFLRYMCTQNNKSIVFLGDYVDRGQNSLKSILLILKLKYLFPDNTFLLRGNHEDKSVNSKLGFKTECINLYGAEIGIDVWKKVNYAFDYLSIAAILDNNFFCVHGGISPELTRISKINDIHKPIHINRDGETLVSELLWSDPSNSVNWFMDNKNRGIGYFYGHDAVINFLDRHRLKHILRAHQECQSGFANTFSDNTCITIFSSHKYGKGIPISNHHVYSRENNSGKILNIKNNWITYESISTNNKLD